MEPAQLIAEVVRTSYGRLLAYLSARSRDVAGAEDALGEALRAALERWPLDGVPEKPEAWLLAAARRRMIDEARRTAVREAAEPTLIAAAEEARVVSEAGEFPDERLKLLFVCAHTAIDPAARTPLMLQTVLGLDAARIASAFLVAPAAMSQRLVRAKTKIRATRLRFEVPERPQWAERLPPVLDAIYAAYGTGWEDAAGADARHSGLAAEAIWLARVLVSLLPDAAEARGLLALMLHCEARRGARRSATGEYIPLAEQDSALWSREMIVEAERELALAAAQKTPGHFQLEAAIQSVHAQRGITGQTNWPMIALLYEGLAQHSPTLGVLTGRAAALAEAHGPAAGLAALDAMGHDAVATYQPYWAVRAHLLARLDHSAEAARAYERAIGLSEDAAVRSFLLRQKQRVG